MIAMTKSRKVILVFCLALACGNTRGAGVGRHLQPSGIVRVQVPEVFQSGRDIARGKFLVASQYFMKDPLFAESVILLIQHDEKGTIGLIMNHTTSMSVHEAFPENTELLHLTNPIYIGGPVAPKQFFLLVRGNHKREGCMQVMDEISFCVNQVVIQDLLSHESRKERIRLFAGCSSWAPGQLAAEFRIGGWNLLSADAKAIFETDPSLFWREMNSRTTQQQTRLW